MDAFDRAGGREGVGFPATGGPGGGEAKDGAKAFPPGQKAVTHSLVDEGGVGLLGDQTVQGLFDHGQAGFPIGLGFHGALI